MRRRGRWRSVRCGRVAISLLAEGDDCNGNGIPDDLEAFGDSDGDGDVDQEDFGVFQTCYTQDLPSFPQEHPCHCLDYDGDDEIDQTDFTAFEACMSGANVPADPACKD